MLIPSVRIGISTQRKITKLRVARTRTRTAVRRGWRPKTRRRVRVARESGSTLECSMLNVSVFHAPQRASAPVWTMEHHGLSIEDTRFTRETPDYKFVPSQLMLKAEMLNGRSRSRFIHSAFNMQHSALFWLPLRVRRVGIRVLRDRNVDGGSIRTARGEQRESVHLTDPFERTRIECLRTRRRV